MADEGDREWSWGRPGNEEFLRAKTLLRNEFSGVGMRRYLHDEPAIEAAAKVAVLWIYWKLRVDWRGLVRREIDSFRLVEKDPSARFDLVLAEYCAMVLARLKDGKVDYLGKDERVPLAGWFLPMIRNKMIDLHRSATRTSRRIEWHENNTTWPTDPWQGIQVGRAMECLEKLGQRWPEGERVIKERIIDEKSAEELGTELRKTGRTVNRWLEHALDLLRKCVLQGEGTEE